MNFMKALQSGKPFKRPEHPDWIDPNFAKLELTRVDLEAGDWDIQDKTARITKQQLKAAFQQAKDADDLAQRLGL